MNKATNEIIAIKTEVRERNWEMLVYEYQQSELSVKTWREHVNNALEATIAQQNSHAFTEQEPHTPGLQIIRIASIFAKLVAHRIFVNTHRRSAY